MASWKNPFSFVLLLLSLALVSCKDEHSPAASQHSTASTNQQTFQVKGVIQELKPGGKSVVIKHEEVPNYMPGMTMPFDVKDAKELAGLQKGDAVSFRMIVTDTDGWIDHITKLAAPTPTEPVTRPMIRVVRDVPPLNVGDPLPEYHFTNELGKTVSTSQFKGQAVAFTFFFTRCPFPTFCPFLSNSFGEAQRKLLTMPNAPSNWRLLSISFDTDADSPETLKTYATGYKYNPEHWSFVTGDLTDITALGDQVGEFFGRDETGSISHNLRTVVIDAQGRVQKVLVGNEWTSDELVAEIIKAAQSKP